MSLKRQYRTLSRSKKDDPRHPPRVYSESTTFDDDTNRGHAREDLAYLLTLPETEDAWIETREVTPWERVDGAVDMAKKYGIHADPQ